MLDLILGGGILTALYFLFIRGHFFRFLLWIFGAYGIHIFLYTHCHPLTETFMTILTHPFPWSIVIGFTICLLAIITTRLHKETYV